MKTKAERSIEALTWAAVIIWMGLALVTHLLGYVWLIVMVLGIILLSSAIYQRSRGWQTSLSLWVAGIWMAVFSVIEIIGMFTRALNNGDGLQIDLWVYLGIALVSMGVAVVLRHVNFPTVDTSSRRRRTDEQNAYGPASYIPRAVQEDYSVGYVPPAGQEDYSAGYAPQGQGTAAFNGAYSAGYPVQGQPPSPAPQGGAGYQPGHSTGYPAQGQPPSPAPQGGAGYQPGHSAGYPAQGQPPSPAPQGGAGYQAGYNAGYPAQGQPAERYDPAWNTPAAPQAAPRPGQHPSASPRARRAAQPVEEPSDLDARVEDIIRRSRERRDVDNLPY